MDYDAAVGTIRHNMMTCCVCCKDEGPCADCISIPMPQCDLQLLQSVFDIYLRLSSRKNLSAAATTPAWTSTLNVDNAATMGPLHKSTCSSCLVLTELQRHRPGDSRLIFAMGGSSEKFAVYVHSLFDSLSTYGRGVSLWATCCSCSMQVVIIQHRCQRTPSVARTVAGSEGVKKGREAMQQARRRSIRTAARCSKIEP